MVRIAVVEDEAPSRQLLADYLARYSEENGVSFDVTYFKDGGAIIGDYKPGYDIILMDIQMPELDGIEATRRIRAFLPDIPIIAMTAHTMKGDAEKCLEAGMQDHIAKPIDPETLFAALQRARG